MAKSIPMKLQCMVMEIEEKEFDDKDKRTVIRYIKLKVQDRTYKNVIDAKYSGTIEEFNKLGIEETEIYNCEVEMKLYKSGNNQCASFTILSFNK